MVKRTTRYLALLRGINVGGNNIISKEDLKQCFEDLGLENVLTYIQSGNILFRSSSRSIPRLTTKIEVGLSERFSYNARAVVLSQHQYQLSLDSAHKEWGRSDDYKHNALFTFADLSPQQVLNELPTLKDDVEIVSTGPGVLFWSAAKSHLTATTMMVLAKSANYKRMTVRNHNTVFKLQELFTTI